MDNFLLGLGHGTEHFSFFLDLGVIHIPHTKLAAGTFYLSIMHDVTVQSLMSLQPCLKCDINLLWIIILITIYFSKVKEDMVANIVQSLCDLLHIFSILKVCVYITFGQQEGHLHLQCNCYLTVGPHDRLLLLTAVSDTLLMQLLDQSTFSLYLRRAVITTLGVPATVNMFCSQIIKSTRSFSKQWQSSKGLLLWSHHSAKRCSEMCTEGRGYCFKIRRSSTVR